MAGDEAVADAGRSLVEVLRTGVADLVDPDAVALAAPTAVGPARRHRLTLFLYGVAECPHLRNDGGRVERTTDATAEPGRLALDLRYLLTAHPPGGGRDGDDTEMHELLGRAVRVLHENAILAGDDLHGSLAGGGPVHVTTDPGERATALDIWHTFEGVPYRPSVAYLVTPVVGDGSDDGDDPVDGAPGRPERRPDERGRREGRGRPDERGRREGCGRTDEHDEDGERGRGRGRSDERGQGR